MAGTAEPAVLDSRVAYWRAALAAAGQLQLPCDYPRVNTTQFSEQEECLDLDNELCKAVLKYSMARDVTPYTIVLASFSILLQRFTREEKIVVGSSTSECQPLVLRVDIEDSMKLEDLVSQVKEAEALAETNEVPFQTLMKEVFPEGRKGLSVFQVRVLNRSDVNNSTLEAASCDWTLFVEQAADSKRLLPLRLRLVYNSVLFKPVRIVEVLKQVTIVMSNLLDHPTNKVQDMSLQTAEAKAVVPDPLFKLDDSWNGSIFSHLARRAVEHPDRPLVVHGSKVYSYAHINSMANRLANFLIKAGIKPEDRVAMYAHRSTAIVIGILGIMKSGATFTVVDPAYPVKRQTVYLEVAQPRAIVTLAAAGAVSAEVQGFIDAELDVCCQLNGLSPDELGPLAEYSSDDPGVAVGPDSIGTLSFTSGSTGKPKAVRGRHISLTHFYPWMSTEFGMGENDRFSMLSGIAHDPIQRDVFTPIFMGASIYIPDAEDIGNPGALAKWVAKYEVTVTHLTPAMGQLLTANATAQMPKLRTALFVGDVLTKRDVIRLQALAPNITVVNMYGTTETQRAVSYLKVHNDSTIELQKEIFPAGRGMKDVQLLVMTRNDQVAGIGELGELYVRSPHLSAGYMGLPEATAAKFLVNPFTNDPRDRLYRTGDLGRYMPDGVVECIGRADDQVKIRGFRIELGEIDTYLGQHPDVRENKTLVMRDRNEEKRIISFFVPNALEYSLESILKHLAEKLPHYAVPSIVCPLEKMPLNPNGKVDKNKLPYPDTAQILAQQRKRSATREKELTDLQKQLVGLWEKVLARPVDVEDNFFEIGGHSILATQLTFQMHELLKQEMPLDLLYQYPTVLRLSGAIESTRANPALDLSSKVEVEVVDVKAEAVLPDDITGVGRTYTPNMQPANIFLTGATGFLGAFLLHELAATFPQATVHCLVRAAGKEAASARIRSNLRNHLLWDDSLASRFNAVVGDLAKPRFGLSEDEFAGLRDSLDLIYHNGALVHWVYPYSKLKPYNVTPTEDILRLALRADGQMAPVHFVSSTSVFDSPYYFHLGAPVAEADSLDGGAGLTVGYGQSKCVAEKMMMLARDRGIPMTIFRPGYVVGHRETGVMNVDDYLVRLLKGCIQLGKVPDMNNRVNMCTVDYVAKAIVAASTKPGMVGKAFHLYNPDNFRFNDFFGSLLRFGYAVEKVSYLEWRDSLRDMTMQGNDSALYPLLHFVLDDLPTKSQSPILERSTLDEALATSGLACPRMDDMMGVYLSYLVKTKYLGGPSRQGSEGVQPLPDLHLGEENLSVLIRSERK